MAQLLSQTWFDDVAKSHRTQVKSDASYQNRIGFYTVEDDQGSIIDSLNNVLKPGDTGYIEAAIASAVRTFAMKPAITKDFNFADTSILSNKILAPILITNSTFENYLTLNPGNAKTDGNVHAYVNYIKGNTDQVDHFRLLGDNNLGLKICMVVAIVTITMW